MELLKLEHLLRENPYPGRGIVLGRSADGRYAVVAYFIMGRSENSRNRVFVVDGEGIRTEAFDPAKLSDPSLIIYAPVRVLGGDTIVTNGDQTDTIYSFLSRGKSFADALRTRTFEPDKPNFTPRISGLLHGFDYRLSILKSADGNPDSTRRYFYQYENPIAGEGHFLHTYRGDGNPLPSFEGEPERVEIEGGIDSFTECLWDSLNEENKVSLFVRYIDVAADRHETRIVNKNK
ncbi:IMP cyclohydrolase [Anaerotruncus colihominis]|uniref:IMP cyclohydrolase n=1 Tax=Anaerotruncus colihominis TaxID=169435 RepID=UPI0026ED6D85|nr:IMP cyclohydrolase [Anaerotruncus colihominis]